MPARSTPPPERRPNPAPAADPDSAAPPQGYAPSMDPSDPRSREEREAEAFAALPEETKAGLTDQMKPPPLPEAPPS